MPELTIGEIIDRENELAKTAPDTYGPYFELPALAISCLSRVLHRDAEVTPVFVSQWGAVRNYLMLALLSLARRHRIQAAQNLRIALESWAIAVYTLGHLTIVEVMSEDPDQNKNSKKNIRTYAYKWLQNKYPEISERFRVQKDLISGTDVHGNLTGGASYFPVLHESEGVYRSPFFDEDGSGGFIQRFNFWRLGHVATLLVQWTGLIAHRLGFEEGDNDEDRLVRLFVLDELLIRKLVELRPGLLSLTGEEIREEEGG